MANNHYSDVGQPSFEAVDVDLLSAEPTRLWDELYSKERVCHTVEPPLSYTAPIRDDALRFVVISDTHGRLDEVSVPNGDVLLHCGDFTNFGDEEEIRKFDADIGRLSHHRKIVIAGNHELGFDPDENLAARKAHSCGRGTPGGQRLLTNCTYLQDSMTEVCGVKIYGASWVPLAGYSFSQPRGAALLEKWLRVPPVDVLMTHTPPLGHNDIFRDGNRWGCAELLNCVERRIRPRFHVFGHVHERNGWTTNGTTFFINAAICSHANEPVAGLPHVFDVPLPAGQRKPWD